MVGKRRACPFRVYFGVKVALSPFFQSKIKMQKVSCAKPLEHNEEKVKKFFTLGTFTFIAIMLWALYLIFVANSVKLWITIFVFLVLLLDLLLQKHKSVLHLHLEIFLQLEEVSWQLQLLLVWLLQLWVYLHI